MGRSIAECGREEVEVARVVFDSNIRCVRLGKYDFLILGFVAVLLCCGLLMCCCCLLCCYCVVEGCVRRGNSRGEVRLGRVGVGLASHGGGVFSKLRVDF